MSLEKLGWNDYFQNNFEPYSAKGFLAARVIAQYKGNYTVQLADGVYNGKLSGKFMHNADLKKDYPTVGDWVAVKRVDNNDTVIYAVLPRKSYFARKLAISGGRKFKNGMLVGGNIEEQIIGSNIDIAFIVSGLDGNFNISRLERYITLVLSSGAEPVILLNKCDLCDDVPSYVDKIKAAAKDIEVYAISAMNNINMDIFEKFLCSNKTLVFLGSSGVGKSSIINSLFGDEMLRTSSVSTANGKGRHTTTGAQLLQHNSGCLLIDTPGIRELQLWGDEEVLSESFQDVHELSKQCKFSDCKHAKEIGCAIKQAIEEGTLSEKRFNSYKSQLEELKHLKEQRKAYEKGRR